jgi:DNA-binding FrmR family transcriptional regulator
MQQRDILIRKLQSATTYLETIQVKYQDREDPLELAQPLQAVVSVLQEIRREVLLQELTTVLHTKAISAATRKEKVVKIFQSLA